MLNYCRDIGNKTFWNSGPGFQAATRDIGLLVQFLNVSQSCEAKAKGQETFSLLKRMIYTCINLLECLLGIFAAAEKLDQSRATAEIFKYFNKCWNIFLCESGKWNLMACTWMSALRVLFAFWLRLSAFLKRINKNLYSRYYRQNMRLVSKCQKFAKICFAFNVQIHTSEIIAEETRTEV